MDCAPMHLINKQDLCLKKIPEADNSSSQSRSLRVNDCIMVTEENGQTPVIEVLSQMEDTDDSDMDQNCGHIISDDSTNRTETKIKLNFSVDRLLGGEYGDEKNCRIQRTVISTNTIGGNALIQEQYECCKYLRSNHHQIIPHRSNHEKAIILSPSADKKSVVRPTPIRALSSGAEDVLSYSSILKFHHHQHQHQHHHQPASISALSSLMAPFNGVKSLQINQQHFCQQVNVQPTAKSLDSTIPTTATQTQTIAGSISVSTASSITSGAIANNGKRKRSWSRAVFSNLQRKGLEIQFQQQKYITKPDRRKLAARLNLTDAQVKVWFQNRRMKWRHTRENLKSGQEKPVVSLNISAGSTNTESGANCQLNKTECYTSSSDSDEDEIDVVE